MTIKEPCKTLTMFMYLNQALQSFCKGMKMSKGLLSDYQRALKDLDKANFLEPNNANVKMMLEDLDKANFFEPNYAFTRQNHGNVKPKLKDYQRALEDCNNVNDLEPNDAFTLQSCAAIKTMLKDYQGMDHN